MVWVWPPRRKWRSGEGNEEGGKSVGTENIVGGHCLLLCIHALMCIIFVTFLMWMSCVCVSFRVGARAWP